MQNYFLPPSGIKKEIVWRDKPFLKSHYFAFLHVPVNIGAKITEGMKKIEEAGLQAEQMVLSKNDGMVRRGYFDPNQDQNGYL